MVTRRWIQTFTNRHGIVSRALTGIHQLSAAKQLFIEKEVAFHLCSRNRGSLPLVENLSATVRSLSSRSAPKE